MSAFFHWHCCHSRNEIYSCNSYIITMNMTVSYRRESDLSIENGNIFAKHMKQKKNSLPYVDGRPRQHIALLTAWLVREFLPLPRTAGVKTNLRMCLRRCESSSLGRFAERVGSWLNFAAADVPCKTAPFASFSGRAEKEGPARPERGSTFSSLIMNCAAGIADATSFSLLASLSPFGYGSALFGKNLYHFIHMGLI